MAKITLNPLSGSYASVTAINARLQEIEDVLNDNILWRDGFDTEPNEMNKDLDMNGNSILNIQAFAAQYVYLGAYPTAPTEVYTGVPLSAEHAGYLYFNTTSNDMWVWTGAVWGLIGTAQNSASSVTIADALNNFGAATNVEEALEELFDGSTKNSTVDGTETLENKTIILPVINDGVSGTAIDTDGTLTADSDTLIPSQSAVKSYVDNRTPQSGQRVLLERQYVNLDTYVEFPSVFDNSKYYEYSIEFEDIMHSIDNCDLAFQLTANNGVSYIASGYRPNTGNSFIYLSLIPDADNEFYSGACGASGQLRIYNPYVGSAGKAFTYQCTYPKNDTSGSPYIFAGYSARGGQMDTSANITGFRFFYADTITGLPKGTLNYGNIRVFGYLI